MRKLPIILTLLSLAFSGVASAVEYVTLTPQNRRINIDPSDLIEIVGYAGINGSITLFYPQGSTTGVAWGDGRSRIGHKFTGYSKVTFENSDITLISMNVVVLGSKLFTMRMCKSSCCIFRVL